MLLVTPNVTYRDLSLQPRPQSGVGELTRSCGSPQSRAASAGQRSGGWEGQSHGTDKDRSSEGGAGRWGAALRQLPECAGGVGGGEVRKCIRPPPPDERRNIGEWRLFRVAPGTITCH